MMKATEETLGASVKVGTGAGKERDISNFKGSALGTRFG
jgi:hypothetical protein